MCLTGAGSGFVAWLVGRLMLGGGGRGLRDGPDADGAKVLPGGGGISAVVQAGVRVLRGVRTLETTRVKHAGRGGANRTIATLILMTTFALLHSVLQVGRGGLHVHGAALLVAPGRPVHRAPVLHERHPHGVRHRALVLAARRPRVRRGHHHAVRRAVLRRRRRKREQVVRRLRRLRGRRLRLVRVTSERHPRVGVRRRQRFALGRRQPRVDGCVEVRPANLPRRHSPR